MCHEFSSLSDDQTYPDMRKLITISLLVVSFCAYGQKAKGPIMHWREYSAKDNAYPASDYFPLDKEKIFCYLSNNDSSIYIDLIIPDPEVQRLILTFGMNIWIDNSGKEDKTMGVRYPLGSTSVKADLNRKGEERSDSEELMLLRNSSLEMAYEIEVGGFGEDIPPRIQSKGGNGFCSSIRYSDDGNLLYRMVIPAKSIVLQEAKGKVVPFSIGIEYGNVMASIPKSASSSVTRKFTTTQTREITVPGNFSEGNPPLTSVAAQRSVQAYTSTPGGTSGKSRASSGKSIVAEPVKPIWIKGLLLATK